MSLKDKCLFNPKVSQGEAKDPVSLFFCSPEREEYAQKNLPYELGIELTNKCQGSCSYCFSTSLSSGGVSLPKERIISLLDEAERLGVKLISWYGGEPFMHPDWFELMNYAAQKGMKNEVATSTIISRAMAQQIMKVQSLDVLISHIDTIDPVDYAKVHSDPRTLELKVQGYKNLLEAGFPPEKVLNCVTVTKPILGSLEKTLDWAVDEMGSQSLAFTIFLAEGYGSQHKQWEPSLSDVRKVLELRAKKLGQHWLRIGASDAGKAYCQTLLWVTYEGTVMPCGCMRDYEPAGNIYSESLEEIFKRSWESLLFKLPIKGPCGESCSNRDVCFGCRATAFHFLDDALASDPKCFLNPEAKEYYFS